MMLRIVQKLCRMALLALFVVITSVVSYAQGQVEVTGHLGVVGGIGSHGSFGASIGAPVADRLIVLGDLSYIPMGGQTIQFNGSTIQSSAKGINFNASLQYEFQPTRAVVPYAGAGLGLLRTSFSASSTGPGSFNAGGSSTDLYFNFGGGLRYYINERWGIRPELQMFAGTDTYARFAGGIFYQFGE